MKFYVDDKTYISYYKEISNNKLTAIYHYKSKNSYVQFFKSYSNIIIFFKNGKYHNNKNFAHISNTEVKEFYSNGKLYGKVYGDQIDFDKKSWRKFVKLQVFL